MEVASFYKDREQTLAESPCEHCSLPVGLHPVRLSATEEGPLFCCTGCMLVHDALQNAGYSDTYYKLKSLTPSAATTKPPQVRIDPLRLSEIDTKAFLEAHTSAGKQNTREATFFLDGVHCAACVWLVERMPFEVEGVFRVTLDLSRARLSLTFDPEQVRLSEVALWLAQFGYVIYPAHEQRAANRTTVERRLLLKMGVCWALAGNVMLFAFALYSGLGQTSDTSLAIGAQWASLILALVSVGYGGSEFFRKAWASLKVSLAMKRLNHLHMDIPISLGILVGFGHSAWATISGQGEIWFDSITVLIAALLTARWLQLRSRRLAGDASDRLLNLIPSMVRLMTPDDEATTSIDNTGDNTRLVNVNTLQHGDMVLVPAGEVVPVDGMVTKGASKIDKSVLTGESAPVPITSGMWIEAGATNLQTSLQICVHAAGAHTRVGKLMVWINDRKSKSAPVVLMADRLSGYFVIGLLFLTTATCIGWMLLDPSQVTQRVVALLVISCPCALGMATPLAMAVAAGRAARSGIYIKSDEATQQLTEIDAVVLDKTGTLTEGCMSVVEQEGDVTAIVRAARLEKESNHPIAKAILEAGKLYNPSAATEIVKGFEAVAGDGIRGWVAGKQVAVGRPTWIDSFSSAQPSLTSALDRFALDGYTPVAISVDGVTTAALGIGDRLRPEAKATLEALRQQGKSVYLLSGDHNAVVHKVAKELGIAPDHAAGDMSPEEKKLFIEQLQSSSNKKVAMIGDGVNDAAALQAAAVGIAVEGGSTPSLVAADLFLTREGLEPILEAIQGAKHVMKVIKRNLTFSLVYNALGASAAILGLVTPLVAAIAMPFSSLVVVIASVMQKSFSR